MENRNSSCKEKMSDPWISRFFLIKIDMKKFRFHFTRSIVAYAVME